MFCAILEILELCDLLIHMETLVHDVICVNKDSMIVISRYHHS